MLWEGRAEHVNQTETPIKNCVIGVCSKVRTYKQVHNINNKQLLLNHISKLSKSPNFPTEGEKSQSNCLHSLSPPCCSWQGISVPCFQGNCAGCSASRDAARAASTLGKVLSHQNVHRMNRGNRSATAEFVLWYWETREQQALPRYHWQFYPHPKTCSFSFFLLSSPVTALGDGSLPRDIYRCSLPEQFRYNTQNSGRVKGLPSVPSPSWGRNPFPTISAGG